MNKARLLVLLVVFVVMGLLVSAEITPITPIAANSHECVIPESGPWPPCATGDSPAPHDECVIPESGPWPPCATGGTPSAPAPNECVIPESGPWPPCATGGAQSQPAPTDCMIPESGPWPPCATDGAPSQPAPAPNPMQLPVTIDTWDAAYFNNSNFLDQPGAREQVVSAVNGQLVLDWGNGAPFAGISAEDFSARLQTTFTVPADANGQRLALGIDLRADNPHTHLYATTQSARYGDSSHRLLASTRGDVPTHPLTLCAGEKVTLTLEYRDLADAANLSLRLYEVPTDASARCLVDAGGRVRHWHGDTTATHVDVITAWAYQNDVTVSWQTTNAARVDLYAGFGNQFDPDANAALFDAPQASTHVFTLGKYIPFKPRVGIVLGNSRGGEVDHSIPVNVSCLEPWFFNAEGVWGRFGLPAACGDEVARQDAAFQPFEHGLMLWHAVDAEHSLVLALLPNGHVRRFDDVQFGAMADVPDDLVPPAGRFKPDNAIGRVWHNTGLVAELGWPTEPETGFKTQVQGSFSAEIAFIAYELPNKQTLIINQPRTNSADLGAVNWRVVTP